MSAQKWFQTSGGRRGGVVVLPWTYVGNEALTYVGNEALTYAEVWVSGEHVREVVAQGDVFTEQMATLGDLRPGDRCLIMVATDGTPGPHTINLHVRASGHRERRLTVEVPDDDDSLIVIEHREPGPDREALTQRGPSWHERRGRFGGRQDDC
jgi:hypothetical protein